MAKIVIIIQARMQATRLPGKPLKKVLGKPLLHYLTDRLKNVKSARQVVIATTLNPADDEIVNTSPVLCFRGSEEDVLDRYYQTALAVSADVIVRITGDCPLMDPKIVDDVISFFLKGHYDYATNTLERTLPRGMDVEVFSFNALEKAAREAKAPEEREHVTPYFYRHPEIFKLGSLTHAEDLSKYRLTVDTKEDFELITLLIEKLYPANKNFSMNDLIQVLQENPEWEKINAHIQQKAL